MELRDPLTHDGARVNSEGQIATEAITIASDRHTNQIHFRVWSLPFLPTAVVADNDYFFYFKNTGNVNYIFTDFRGSASGACSVSICHVSGTAVATAEVAVTPVNRFLGASEQPTVTLFADTDTTGLTDEGVLFKMDVAAGNADQLNHLKTTAGVIVPPGQALAIRCNTAGIALTGTLSIAEVV